MDAILSFPFGRPTSWQTSDRMTTETVDGQICIKRIVCDINAGAVTVWGTVEVYRGPVPPEEELAGLMASKVGAQRYV